VERDGVGADVEFQNALFGSRSHLLEPIRTLSDWADGNRVTVEAKHALKAARREQYWLEREREALSFDCFVSSLATRMVIGSAVSRPVG
jgi:hypothetical protein